MGQIKRPTKGEYKVTHPLTTRWMDNDIYGHINNVTYYSYFDTAVNYFLINQCGLDIHNAKEIGLVVSSGCEYLKPIAYPEEIDVAIRVDKLGNSSVRYGIAIFKQGENEAVAFGYFVHVFTDRQSNKSTAIPETIRKQLEKILVDEKYSNI